MKSDADKLWEKYSKQKDRQTRNELIVHFAYLVKITAGKMFSYFDRTVDYSELEGYGIFGLIDAIDKYDYYKGNKFETYASLRIRGAILDQIRKNDWIPRTIRQRQKQIDAAIKDIEAKTGSPATDEEIAAYLGISDDEFVDWQSQMKVTNVISLNEFMESGADVPNDSSKPSNFTSPEENLDQAELKEMLIESLELLTDKEKKVVLLYYYEELTLKEISMVLEVTESRVSQLHTKALAKMKAKLGDYYMGIMATF